jgi:hypothetical protein
MVGLNSAVGIATRYGLDGPGIEYGGGEVFRTPIDRPLAHPASFTKGTGFLSRHKEAGAWR